jgi:hypothetical protein
LISKPINRFYYGYLSKTSAAEYIARAGDEERVPDDGLEHALMECVRESFMAGARWQLRETAKLSPYISKFLEMVVLLGPDAPRDVWVEMTDVMPHDDEADNEWLENVPF